MLLQTLSLKSSLTLSNLKFSLRKLRLLFTKWFSSSKCWWIFCAIFFQYVLKSHLCFYSWLSILGTSLMLWWFGGLVAKSCLTLCDPMDCSPPGSSVHGIFPGKNTGVDCHFLLQEIFPTQGWNLLNWQVDSLPLSHLPIQEVPSLGWQVDSLPLSHQGSPYSILHQ